MGEGIEGKIFWHIKKSSRPTLSRVPFCHLEQHIGLAIHSKSVVGPCPKEDANHIC